MNRILCHRVGGCIQRCMGIENLMISDIPAVVGLVAGLHGGGSLQMETIIMMSRYDLEKLKGIAKYLFGIEQGILFYDRLTVTPRKMLERFRKKTV